MTPHNHSEGRPRATPRDAGKPPTGRSRAQRARALRRRVISGAVALFVATWLLIAVVLVSGHDPALARTATVADTSTAQTTATTSTPTTTTSTSSSTPSPTSGSTSGVSSVTTQQS
jgi:Mn2+/Fe2+ NRAMP family transporter